MAVLGAFSSLLQLGVGTGIGLSVFRAPVDLRVRRISRTIEGEVVALKGVATPFARTKRRDMLDLRFQFVTVREELDNRLRPFMIAAVIGAFLNLLALIAATTDADRVVSSFQAGELIFLSVGWFLIVLAALELLARLKLGTLVHDLQTLRQRRTPPVQLQSSLNVPAAKCTAL